MKFVNWCRDHYELYTGASVFLYFIMDIILCCEFGNIPVMLAAAGFGVLILAVNIWTERQSQKIDDEIIANYMRTRQNIN